MYHSVYHLSAIRASRQLVIYSQFGKFNYTLSLCAIIGEAGGLWGIDQRTVGFFPYACS